MKEFITKINRERGFTYRIDKEGKIYKESYNWFKDPYTLVTIAVIILSLMYYIQISQMMTAEKNFEETCLIYVELRNQWIKENPGKIPSLKELFEMKVDNYEPPSLNYEK